MVIIVLLALTAYHFSDHALEELKISDSTHRQASARAVADSGIHYAAAWLTNYVTNVEAGVAATDQSLRRSRTFQDRVGCQRQEAVMRASSP